MLRAVRVIVINIVVFCVLAEVLALVLYYNETGRLFYTYRRPYDPITETREGRLTGEGLHPYFGPTHRQGQPFDIPEGLRPTASVRQATNNFGFVASQNYPVARTDPRQFFIGIFGGSVGVWFCQVGVHRLVERLEQNAFFKDKELLPLCFSHEGYKQPQQLIVLAYFLSLGQPFDLVLNIDGFNEVALSSLNSQRGLDISMPSVMHLDPLINLIDQATLTPDKVRSLAAISEYKDRVNRLVARIAGNDIAAYDFVLRRMYMATLGSYRAEVNRFASLASNPSLASLLIVTPNVATRTETQLFDEVARAWAMSSKLMHSMLAARGVPYFHVLQPNQYFTTRTFSADEDRLARSDASPFKPGAVKGYPALVRESASGTFSDVRFFNGVGIFDNERERVYMDDCCHYTLRGNQILGEFIARQILSSKGAWN